MKRKIVLKRKTTLETSGEDIKLHSKRVEKMSNYTRNEWGRYKTALKTSGEDVKLHSKRVGKMYSSAEDLLGKLFIDCLLNANQKISVTKVSSPLISSVFSHLPHSFRV
jgi:hypothetical protein